jgi:predicted dehydrogenase
MSRDVAIAGLGYFSRFQQDAWSRCPEVRVIALADSKPDNLTAAAALFPHAQRFADAEEMLGAVTPDCLDIVTRPRRISNS